MTEDYGLTLSIKDVWQAQWKAVAACCGHRVAVFTMLTWRLEKQERGFQSLPFSVFLNEWMERKKIWDNRKERFLNVFH